MALLKWKYIKNIQGVNILRITIATEEQKPALEIEAIHWSVTGLKQCMTADRF